MFLTFEEAEEIAGGFLGPSVELSYCGVNAWPDFQQYSFADEYYVFRYEFKGEYRLGGDRYIAISNQDSQRAFLVAHGD